MKIFISSPKRGLKKEREYLLEKKENFGVDISAMELFVASPSTPKEVCLSELRSSDIVILLVGPYYGSIDTETGISFTEIEYNEASDLGIPIFVFVKIPSENTEWNAQDEVGVVKNKHISFMQRISKERYFQKFCTAEQLLSFVKPAIDRYQSKSKKKYAPFVEYEEYFSVFLGEGKLFRHDYPLEGRDKELKDILNFMNSNKRVLVIIGRGGIGKSKILYEVAKNIEKKERYEWKRILFIRENVIFDENTLLKIPSGKSIFILEDAHRYGYLKNVLSIFGNSDLYNRVKLIISARPSGRDYLDSVLSTSIDVNDVTKMDEIKDLDIDETKRIISNIIGKNRNLIDYLANMTKDCPLATIIGSKLVTEKRIDPWQIRNSEDFQRAVLDKFLEEIQKVKLENSVSNKLLTYLAALAPVRPADEKFSYKLSSILKISNFDLRKSLDFLEDKGLLLRRGRLVRLVPDLLSDHILYNACVANDGTPTTFADEVFRQFHDTHMSNILANVSELEWRSQVASKTINLLEKIWLEITKSFKNAHNYLRIQILDEIEKAAFFQPKQVLDIIKIAINEPSKVEPEGEYAEMLKGWGQIDILEKLPKLLKNIAYHFDHVKECCYVLWDLGKDDKRELNSYPEHAIRILQDLASYTIKKPVSFHERIIEFIEESMSEPGIHNHKYSPLDILDELLEKEGEFTESKGAVFTMSTFRLNVGNIMPIRKRTLTILKKCFSPSLPPHVISRSFKSLMHALTYPVGSFGRVITDEEEREWLPEQLEILDIIKNGTKEISSQAINVRVKTELRWFQLHGRRAELKDRVTELLNSIEEDYDFRLFRAIAGNFIEYYDTEKSFEEREKEITKEMCEVAHLIKEKEKNSQIIFNKLNSVIGEFDKFKMSVNPNHLFSELTKQFPEIAISIYELGVENPDKNIMRFSSSFLWPLVQNNEYKNRLKEMIKNGLATKNYNLCINIAHAYAWGGLIEGFDRDDINNIKFLIKLKNKTILDTVIHAISKLGTIDNNEAKKLVLMIKIDENGKIDNLFSVFNKTYGILLDTLDKKEIESLLSKLISADIFRGQHYHIDKFLEFVSKKYPDLSVSFLLKRLEYSRSKKRRVKDYTPLPYLGFRYAFCGISQIPDYDKYVRKIRELSLDMDLDVFWLPKLFEAISDGYSEKSMRILSEWLSSKDAAKIEGISLLLRDAPDSFLFNNYAFVGKLILAAQEVSEKCLRNVRSNLFGIAVSGGRHRSIGVPSEKCLQLKKMGKEISERFDSSHPARQFYLDVSNYGNREIKEELQRDEEFLDE